MINWLNSNQGFVMSILTLVYVLATIVIVIYNRKSIHELQKTREEESRPYIFAHLHRDPRDMCFYLRVKNYGKTGGIIDKISITPHLKFCGEKDVGEFLNNVILAPNQLLHFIILEKHGETSDKDYEVEIQYHQTNDNKTFKEKYTLLLQYSSEMGYTNSTKSNYSNEENALQSIANYLDSIRNKI